MELTTFALKSEILALPCSRAACTTAKPYYVSTVE
jgi:hypothetical protein